MKIYNVFKIILQTSTAKIGAKLKTTTKELPLTGHKFQKC